MATETAASGIDATPTNNPSVESKDPFASSRTTDNDPFAGDKLGDLAGSDDMGLSSSPPAASRDRRMSKEWDASKVPPSRFQKREGSIYSTPNSRDAHVKGASRDQAYHDKLKEKGWAQKITGGAK
ncbi:uncharacterized protein BDZ99DRAFT_468385 [Mytilinidion resinicola]|uniref:Uncharacterized protein n=1 Tax=Mytilinidion resinicola TaxID=574789 RepID=A0A6A6Y2Z7_9PEZI|nr:uncharacterized protein BDZ99DRAFT_468385 [Mytilinidion resinicola]KAF2803040.1 hypothetical protein BDZ99DRAFT_468385 [Mytilinidion resinicola]